MACYFLIFLFVIRKVIPGKYQHYKGKIYEVIGTGLHSETLEELVVYKAINSISKNDLGPLWVRPKKRFLEKVLVNGRSVPRFKIIRQKNTD